jgi:hypothetical protein
VRGRRQDDRRPPLGLRHIRERKAQDEAAQMARSIGPALRTITTHIFDEPDQPGRGRRRAARASAGTVARNLLARRLIPIGSTQ